MKQFFVWWGCMGILVSGLSQSITVSDLESGLPVEFATVSGEQAGSIVVTDRFGRADISMFSGDTLVIRLVGYSTARLTFDALQQNAFKLSLDRTSTLLKEVVVSAYRPVENRETSLHIDPLSINLASDRGGFSLTDVLARAPGVTQLSSGIGISKPVIRGLYGNRILILFSGLRFDNQQWQDEHGLGLSDVGVSKVEIIKGPLSLLYGTEAVGGVINILEETPPPAGSREADASINTHSNTLGGTEQVGFKANFGDHWVRIRASATDHSDYNDGNGNRVLNSRFKSYQVKTSYGFTKGRWTSVNHYHFSLSRFGFVFNDLGTYFAPDRRWSRSVEGPHHNVMLNVLSSINTLQLSDSELSVTAGLQSNLRSEDEGGGELSLKMHLITGQYALKWRKSLNSISTLVLANYSSLESNINYGRRKLVPDAWMGESALSGYLEHRLDQLTIEYGAGVGFRSITTLLTPTVNSAEKELDPFSQVRTFANGMAGLNWTPIQKMDIKWNVASGVRAPNLSELSSNGLHEGIYTYEIGNPDMRNEQNVNGEMGIYYQGNVLQLSASIFYNRFFGYIYLEPTTEDWFGFPVFRYRQHDALIYGNEFVLGLSPKSLEGWSLTSTYAGLIGKLGSGEYLPYMPAQKLTPELRYSAKRGDRSWYGFVNTSYVFAQNRLNHQEVKTPAYQLVNLGAGYRLSGKKATYELGFMANNLLNEAYYDHMSRFKNFGLLNIGRDLSITLKIKFLNQLKTN